MRYIYFIMNKSILVLFFINFAAVVFIIFKISDKIIRTEKAKTQWIMKYVDGEASERI